VILVHSREHILPELARFAQRVLEHRGVEMRMRTRVVAPPPSPRPSTLDLALPPDIVQLKRLGEGRAVDV